MRIAFDVHGVLDTLPEYRDMMRSLFIHGHTIFIISGQPLDKEMKKLLKKHELEVCYDHYRSVETYLLDQGNLKYEIRDGQKFWPDEIWDPVKARICKDEKIDMIFDNSLSYAQTFKKVPTVFSLVIDKTRSIKEKRS
jgi:hypothetical protein